MDLKISEEYLRQIRDLLEEIRDHLKKDIKVTILADDEIEFPGL
jgi:hypothetical protein